MVNQSSTKDSWLKNLILKLKRKPRSGMYVPEIDGLRFVAILAVILFHSHIYYFQDPLIQDFREVEPNRWIEYMIGKGWFGVQLFFIISGFIICLPFALHHLRDNKPVELKKFFIRRFKRIEIPYFIALTFSLIFLVFIQGRTFSDLLPHYLAGLTYTHNLFYFPDGGLNPLLPPAWTLELEIQFYLLAPFLSVIYAVKHHIARYLIFFITIIALSIGIPELHSIFPNTVIFSKSFILDNLPYFLIGMLIVDLFVSKKSYGEKNDSKTSVSLLTWDFVGLVSGVSTLVLLSCNLPFTVLPFSLGLFVLSCLNGYWLKKCLSFRFFTVFGGMCYSIYLFHEFILCNSYYLFFPSFFNKYAGYNLNYLGIVTMALWILIASIPFYLLIEKPFMSGGKKNSK